jgi:DNA-binding LytR/AlgR family response regulator
MKFSEKKKINLLKKKKSILFLTKSKLTFFDKKTNRKKFFRCFQTNKKIFYTKI